MTRGDTVTGKRGLLKKMINAIIWLGECAGTQRRRVSLTETQAGGAALLSPLLIQFSHFTRNVFFFPLLGCIFLFPIQFHHLIWSLAFYLLGHSNPRSHSMIVSLAWQDAYPVVLMKYLNNYHHVCRAEYDSLWGGSLNINKDGCSYLFLLVYHRDRRFQPKRKKKKERF